ncbi:hypothetical protein GCM10009118_16350 [Wandonia haliotis]|uniref:phospholipase D n=1 Tax=Wandonia haliotis TaxID=574963 RepID=A0ABP3Y4D7_9FLAO
MRQIILVAGIAFSAVTNVFYSQIINSEIEVSNITTDGLTISWDNAQNAASYLKYGYTRNLEQGQLNGGTTLSPEFQISGAGDARLIYVQAIADNGSVTDEGDTLVFITASESSGEIRTYFTKSVNTSYANSVSNEAIQLNNLIDDTLIAYINRVEESLDIAIYNLSSASGISNIAGAINAAYSRGVRVRIIYNEDTGNTGIAQLNSSIPTLESPVPQWPDGHGIMHNKFVIFDAESADPNKPILWTGSTNFTSQQINTDANNVIIVQDQALARTYQLEFEEMWGGSGANPTISASRFGPDKKDNTPHVLSIAGKRVESYFSPSDQVNQRIIQAVNDAQGDLCINTMLITRDDIANAIVYRKAMGLDIRVLVNSQGETTVWDQLESSLGVRLANYSTVTGVLHHKLLIAGAVSNMNPFVLTGSHNWSTSAESRNDENTLIVFDEDVVNRYYQEFMGRFGPIASTDELTVEDDNIRIFPNPSQGNVFIVNEGNTAITSVSVYTPSGKKVYEEKPSPESELHELRLADLAGGIYFVEIKSGSHLKTVKIVLE